MFFITRFLDIILILEGEILPWSLTADYVKS